MCKVRSGLHETRLYSGNGSLVGSGMLLAFASPRVWIVVYPGVSSEFVRARKSLCASRESAGVWLLSSVGSNVASLVLQTVEGLVAERALVRPRKILSGLLCLLRGVLEKRRHEADGGSGHRGGGCRGRWWLLLLLVLGGCFGVEQVGETCRGRVGLHVCLIMCGNCGLR